MTPHLQVETENGKTRIKYLELPDNPTVLSDQPLPEGIEVHPESMDLSKRLIFNYCHDNGIAMNMMNPEYIGEKLFEDGLYPVSVRVKRKEYSCKDDGYDFYAVQCKSCDCKAYAILEEIKENSAHSFTEGSDVPNRAFYKYAMNETSTEHDINKTLEMIEKMEAPDAEKYIYFSYRDENTDIVHARIETSKASGLISELMTMESALSSLRKEVEVIKPIKEGTTPEGTYAFIEKKEVLTLIDKHLNQ